MMGTLAVLCVNAPELNGRIAGRRRKRLGRWFRVLLKVHLKCGEGLLSRLRQEREYNDGHTALAMLCGGASELTSAVAWDLILDLGKPCVQLLDSDSW